jgi:phage gp37-like protein
MSRLGDFENTFVSRLQGATLSGSPVFKMVRGYSGPMRPTLRDAILREQMPAAYVSFVEELTAPETNAFNLGPRYAVTVAAQMLRTQANPRHGDASSIGVFTAIDSARARLDDYEPSGETRFICMRARFLEADDRVAIYELLYRAWPIQFLSLAPAAPTDLAIESGEVSGQILLTWDEPAVDAEHGPPDFYRIYRKKDGEEEFTLIAATAKSPLSITLEDQPTGIDIQYKVRPANPGGEGGASPTAFVYL